MGSEQDNAFRGMYSPGFLHDLHTNIMYTDQEAIDTAGYLADGMAVPTPADMDGCPNLRGFPMNIYEVQESAVFVYMHRPEWQAMLRLLWEFHQISMSVIGWYCDLSMHEVVEIFEKDNRLQVLVQGLLHPYFIPINSRFLRTGPGSIANGAGLPTLVNGSLDDWCCYAAHHFWLNGPNPTSRILMDSSHCISYASVWGMILM